MFRLQWDRSPEVIQPAPVKDVTTVTQHSQPNPVNIERLTRRMGKYALVVAVSQRARELKERQTRLGDTTPTNLIGRALAEIFDGKVKVIEPTEE
jgi:DNA-directed RNA polymerase subunit K/omega